MQLQTASVSIPGVLQFLLLLLLRGMVGSGHKWLLQGVGRASFPLGDPLGDRRSIGNGVRLGGRTGSRLLGGTKLVLRFVSIRFVLRAGGPFRFAWEGLEGVVARMEGIVF